MNSYLQLLGTGTADLSLDKNASSVLIHLNGQSILFDIGHGIAKTLIDNAIKQDDLNHIIISHFHTDHISDLLPYLHSARQQGDKRTTNLNIYGPKGTKVMLAKLIEVMDFLDLKKNPFEFTIEVHELSDNKIFEINKQKFEFISLPPANNHGISFEFNNKRICITGDSYYHKEEISFLQNSDIAIIDAGHLTDQEIKNLAEVTNSKKLHLSHLDREVEIGSLGSNVIVGKDNLKIKL